MRSMSKMCTAALLGLAIFAAAQTQAREQMKGSRQGRVIDGLREPHLLPEEAVWDGVFAALHDFSGGKTDPADPKLRSFVESNLFVSATDAKALFEGVVRARTRLHAATHRLDEALEAGLPEAKVSAARSEVTRIVLSSRDEILSQLSPLGAKALLRYVAVVKQGMKHEVAE